MKKNYPSNKWKMKKTWSQLDLGLYYIFEYFSNLKRIIRVSNENYILVSATDFKSTIIFHGLVYYVFKNLNDDILNSYLFHIPRWIDF